MIKILHRINTKEGLINTPIKYGIEVDIRSNGERLIISHDPFLSGEDFLEWLSVLVCFISDTFP